MRRACIGALLLVLAAPAAAGDLVSPTVILPDATYLAACNATNTHKKDIEVLIEVIDGNGNTQTSNLSLVPPGGTRTWSLGGPGVYGCRFVFKGSDRHVVGTLYLGDLTLPTAILEVIEAH